MSDVVGLGDEQTMILEMAAEFAERELATGAVAADRGGALADGLLANLAEQGLLAIALPEDAGGAGVGLLAALLATEQLARRCPSAAYASSQLALGVALPLAAYGGEAGVALAGEVAMGERAAALAIADGEPAATLEGGALAGVKRGAVGCGELALALVSAGGALVTAEAGSFTAGEADDRLGLRAATSRTITLAGPAGLTLALPAGGLDEALAPARLGLAAVAVGVAAAAREAATRHAQEREQFGVPIARFGAVGDHLGSSLIEERAARAMLVEAARAHEAGQPIALAANAALSFASRIALAAADRGVQVHGGGGFCRDYPAERHYRDAQQCALELGGEVRARKAVADLLLA